MYMFGNNNTVIQNSTGS